MGQDTPRKVSEASAGNPSDEYDTIAYAVSFLQAAKRLSGPRWEDNHPLVVPFYMLIGFSLENGMKAFLEANKTSKKLNWSYSHDLSYLRKLCVERFLLLDPAQVDFVENLSPMHKEHQFRYPQKAAVSILLQPGIATELTNAILKTVFRYIGGTVALN